LGLRTRVTLSLLVPLMVVMAAHAVIRVRAERAKQTELTRRALEESTRIMATALLQARETAPETVGALLHRLVYANQDIAAGRLFDRSLQPIASAGATGIGNVPTMALREGFRTGAPSDLYERRGRVPVFTRLQPLEEASGRTVAVLETVHLANDLEARIGSLVLYDVWLRLGLVAAAVAITTVLILELQIFNRLGRLTRAISTVTADETGARLGIEHRDQLGRVAEAFNDMTARLAAARAQLRSEEARVFDLQQHLRRAERLAVAGKLASSLAHEIGTPLNIISGHTEVVADMLPPAHPVREHLTTILSQIERISRIIRSLLNEVAPQRPMFAAVSLGTIIDGVWPLLAHAARRREIATTRTLDDVPDVHGDPSQLQQVVINLVMNALDACAAGDRITVTAVPEARHGRAGVRLTVADTGPGIPADHRARIFEPFFTTKAAGRGTGLGLAITRDIVTDHRGEIAIDSSDGSGTVAAVWLPCEPPRETMHEPPRIAA
jgi:signal transduction histidine kinase